MSEAAATAAAPHAHAPSGAEFPAFRFAEADAGRFAALFGASDPRFDLFARIRSAVHALEITDRVGDVAQTRRYHLADTGTALDFAGWSAAEFAEFADHLKAQVEAGDHVSADTLHDWLKVAHGAVMIGREAAATAAAPDAVIDGAVKTVFGFDMASGPDRTDVRVWTPWGLLPALHIEYERDLPVAIDDGNGDVDEAAGDLPAMSAIEAVDISHEALRCYLFANDGDDGFEEVVVDCPATVVEGDDGTHYITDKSGIGIVVPPGWSEYTVKPLPGHSPFKF